MSIAAVVNSSAANTSNTSSTDTSTTTLPMQSLGEQDFLTLLVKQMTTQDPLNPQKDTDFIAQMAQFTSLEQTQTIESDLTNLNASQSVGQAASMIGKTAVIQVDSKTTVNGVVSSIDIVAGMPKLVVNGQDYDLSQLTSLTQTPTN